MTCLERVVSMSFNPPEEILTRIIARSGLNPSDGHPLYAYRTTEEELQELRESLHVVFQVRADLTRVEAATFCLFAAEWFRRNHREGGWTYKTIFEGLNINPWREEQIRQNIAGIVVPGMAWWGHAVLRTEWSRRYLATIVCQGGLPLQVLCREQANLRHYFREVLRQHEWYPSESAVNIAQQCDYILPLVLRNEIVYELTAGLITAVAESAGIPTGRGSRSRPRRVPRSASARLASPRAVAA